MLRLRAPAKLNLYLRVIGRRADGYHEIETLFERLDLADELTFEPAPDLVLTCEDPTLPCGEDNLVMKTARLLQQVCRTTQGARPPTNRMKTPGCPPIGGGRTPPHQILKSSFNKEAFGVGARIHLIKRIPIAAGLGGGSSDAAATLLGLNDLWGLHLDGSTLSRLAATLGSDVPFFLFDAPYAIGRGRGDVCEPVGPAPGLAQVLVVPDVRLSTKEIYEALDRRSTGEAQFNPSTSLPDLPRTSAARPGSNSWRAGGAGRIESPGKAEGFGLTAPKPSVTMAVHALCNGSLGELASGLWNDLEPEAIRRCPSIGLIQSHMLDLGCLGSRVSGSGPSVFGLCRSPSLAREIATQLRAFAEPDWRIEIIQTDHPSRRATSAVR